MKKKLTLEHWTVKAITFLGVTVLFAFMMAKAFEG